MAKITVFRWFWINSNISRDSSQDTLHLINVKDTTYYTNKEI